MTDSTPEKMMIDPRSICHTDAGVFEIIYEYEWIDVCMYAMM